MLDESLTARVLAQIAGYPGNDQDALLNGLRASFPDAHFSLCADDDVPLRCLPAASGSRCRLYYIDAQQHCLQLTNDAAAASGLLVGWLDEEER